MDSTAPRSVEVVLVWSDSSVRDNDDRRPMFHGQEIFHDQETCVCGWFVDDEDADHGECC